MGMHTTEPASSEGAYFGLGLHRAARICAAGWGGQVLLSHTTGDIITGDLPAGASLRDLGQCRLKDLQLPERIFQLLHPDLPADFPPLRSLDTLPTNLPVQLSSFIGRQQEITQIKQLLTGSRLVTLVGPGGMGKTRLALQAAADLVDTFHDGVWLVELAALADPALVPQAVAAVLEVREQPGRALTETLADHLRPKHILLLLDNCEHLVAACAQLADMLLRHCPGLRVLATSREAIGITG
ncbi:MAG: ATP-binding protein, partial [Candidatus Methylomirabilaceae bacterium]